MAKKRIILDLTDEKDGVTGTGQYLNAIFPGKVLCGIAGYTKNIPFLVDCGSFQGLDNIDQLNTTFNFDITSPEFSILTHAHLDHYGRYPLAMSQGFHAPVFTTYPTKTFLSEVFLQDCLKIEKRRAKKLDAQSLYTETEIQEFEHCMVPCNFNQKIVYNDNITIHFFDNGHVPGAAVTLITISYPDCEDMNIVITGDYNNRNDFFQVKPLPEWIYELPNVSVIIEATYGGTKSSDLREKCFIDNVVRALSEGKTCIVPAFSFGRTQEVLYKLKIAQDMGILPPRFEIFLDGKTAIHTTSLFQNGAFKMHPNAKDFLPDNLTIVEDKTMRNFLIHENYLPKIFVSSSGSGSYGPSQTYINKYMNNPMAMIHATGHIFPDSKLGRLRDDDSIVAQFFDTDEFSAHAKQEVLVDFVKPFKNLKSVFIHHGEDESKKELAYSLKEICNASIHILSSNKVFRMISDGTSEEFPRFSDSNVPIR
ncbi:MAG: MBL fold metallo-hydrolase [Clostridia bacterium]|nr:MBL fold metallo-hydrolase [Clostridia bacterium]